MYKGRKRAGGLEGGITRVGGAGPDQSGKFKHHLSQTQSVPYYTWGVKKLLMEAFTAPIQGEWDQ